MTPSVLLRAYLSWNLSVAGGFAVFWVLRRFLGISPVRLTSLALLRISQGLLLLSTVISLGLSCVPQTRIPFQGTVHWNFPSEIESRPLKIAQQTSPEKIGKSADLESGPSGSKWRGFLWSAYVKATGHAAAAILLLSILVGGLAFFFRLLSNLKSLAFLLRSATPIRRIAKTLIVVSDRIQVPFSVLLSGRAWIAVPLRMVETNSDFKTAIQHEVQHHRQKDTHWSLAFEILLTVLFLNPFIYFWKKEITELQEFSCDEALIGRKRLSSHEYGSCLIRVAEAALGSRFLQVGTTCMASDSKNPIYFKSFLRRRIEMLSRSRIAPAPTWAGLSLGTLASALVVTLAYGAQVSLRRPANDDPNPGVAAVDPAIQEIAERNLRQAVESENAKGGVAIVADPNTGRILAIANIDKSNAPHSTAHWALGMILEPASFAKTLVAAQAIESGLLAPQERLNCENGSYRFGSRVYHDWKTGGWDHLTVEDSIVLSSDICPMKMAERIGPEGLRKMLSDFGFGPGGTAQNFPEAKTGNLSALDNPLYPDAVPAISAGFGFKATPLELIQAYGAIANGGNLLVPQLANTAEIQGQVVHRVLSAENAEKVKEILRQVVLRGTGHGHAESRYYSTAGKTATSYVPDLTQWELVEGKNKGNFAGFIGFAPLKTPRVEVYIGIRDPHTDNSGAHGGTHAAPVFQKITDEVLSYWKVTPDLR